MAADDLASLLALLLGAAGRWSRREPIDDDAAQAIRYEAIRRAHRRYVRELPVYRRLAEDRELTGPLPVQTIVDELMITSDVFKSYDPRWLDEHDYDRMTQWLGERFTRLPQPDLDGVASPAQWRRSLADDDVYLTFSSGTSGRLSFVARDAQTLQLLTDAGRFTIPTLWEGSDADVDCLVLGPAGRGRGMEVAVRAMARAAGRSHALTGADPDGGPDERAWEEAMAFVLASASDGRRTLVFGTPDHVEEACRRWRGASAASLPEGSVVLTGGGRKSGPPEDGVATRARIADGFGVPASRVIDAYSAAELNTVLMTCADGRYHVPPTLEAVVLDEGLEQIEGDEVAGVLGFLDPFARSYPGFIVPGDFGLLSRAPCPCGLSGPAILGDITRVSGLEPRGCGGLTTPALG